MHEVRHRTREELEAGLPAIRQSPRDKGALEMIVRRPRVAERDVLTVGELTMADGLVGDSWSTRPGFPHASEPPSAEMQLNLMNSRVAQLVAQSPERWPLAGDQLFVDLDLSTENLPVGTRLAIGTAVIEITAPPHTGCRKFQARFGVEAHKFVNAPAYKELHLRGVCAKVVQPGEIRTGDVVKKV